MFKKFLSFLTVLLAFASLSIGVNAQTAGQSDWKNFCFTATQCNEKGSGCQNLKDSVHRAALKVDSATANYLTTNNLKTYVVECLYKKQGDSTPICTTGNAATDAAAGIPVVSAGSYGSVGFSLAPFLANLAAPEVRVANPVDPNLLSGSLMWHDNSATYSRIFFGYYHTPPVEPTSELGQGGEQQGILPIDWESASKVCKPLVWDPFGRVFDSQSLEPVSGATVNLFVKENADYRLVSPADIDITAGASFINPYLTDADGQFSFFVADGTYKLTVTDSGYAFPALASLSPAYAKAYYEIYPVGGIYDIVEKGGDQHRDIPVDSKGSPTITPIKIMDLITQADKIGNVYVQGRVSHALSIVSVYSMLPAADGGAPTRNRLVKEVTADKYGKFSFSLDQSTFDQASGEYFGQIEIKKDSSIFALDTSTNVIVKDFEPLPAYIEGIAKNAAGVAQPNIQVGIFAESSTRPFYTTKTDASGNFKIPSDYIPSLPYKLVYTSGNVATTIKPSKFISDNVAYFASNKTGLYSPHYNDSKVNQKLTSAKAAGSIGSNVNNNQFGGSGGNGGTTGGKSGATGGKNGGSSPQSANANSPLSQNTGVLAILAFVVTLAIVGGIVGFIMLKKKQQAEGL